MLYEGDERHGTMSEQGSYPSLIRAGQFGRLGALRVRFILALERRFEPGFVGCRERFRLAVARTGPAAMAEPCA